MYRSHWGWSRALTVACHVWFVVWVLEGREEGTASLITRPLLSPRPARNTAREEGGGTIEWEEKRRFSLNGFETETPVGIKEALENYWEDFLNCQTVDWLAAAHHGKYLWMETFQINGRLSGNLLTFNFVFNINIITRLDQQKLRLSKHKNKNIYCVADL